MDENREITLGVLFLFLIIAVGIFYVSYSDTEVKDFLDNRADIPERDGFSLLLSPEGVDYNNHTIENTYQGGDVIKGGVNLELDGARADYVVSSNFDNNLTLLEFLERNGFEEGADYNCSSSGCLHDYSSQGQVTSLSVSSGEVIGGFVITGGDVSQVSSVKLSVSSDIGESCFLAPLKIDVLADEENLIVSNQSSGDTCGGTDYTGCFDSDDTEGEVEIDANRYCEKITLPSAPGFELHAHVKNSTTGNADLKMELFDVEDLGEPVAACDLPEHTQNGYEDISCQVSYAVFSSEEYYACITGESGSGANYKIAFETQNACGTNSIGGFGSDVADYDIYARALEFGQISYLSVDEVFSDLHGFGLEAYVQEYILDRYGGDCLPNCAVPVRFLGQEQMLSFSNVEIKYTAQQGTVTSNVFHELDTEFSTIDSEDLDLDVEEANFVIPLGSEEDEFEFYINGDLVFDEEISIAESFEFDLNPRFVAFGQNVLFTAETDHTIVSSTWDFGDGTPAETVSGKQNSHAYTDSAKNEFDLEVTLERSDGASSTKTFSILVGDVQESANLTLYNYRERINLLEEQMDSLPFWIENSVRAVIDVDGLNVSLNSLSNDYDLASTDEDYEEIILDLLELNVPRHINTSKELDNIPLLIGFDNIDISYIEDISARTVNDEDLLKSNIAGWMNEFYNAKISFEQISGFYDDGPEVMLSRFRIDSLPKPGVPDEPYLILGHDIESNGGFMKDYGEKNIGQGGTYITLKTDGSNEVIEFYILGVFDPEDLGAYISPSIDALGDFDSNISPCNFDNVCQEGAGENESNCPEDCSAGRWGWFTFWIVVLLFAALVVYIILQEWYKRNYEKHLFPNKNDLYNLVNFVYNARKTGLTNGEIRKKLKESGWKGEQINYVFKKIDGKRTGMYEIPLFKFIENSKVRKEIGKRQGGRPVDARFIKRPDL